MKSILISIQPQWVEKILNREKSIEIRKTMPKCNLPCNVYIYESKGKEFPFSVKIDTIARDNNSRYLDCKRGMPSVRTRNSKHGEIPFIAYGSMQVVAEFTLNEVECFTTDYRRDKKQLDRIIKDSCVDFETLKQYEYDKHCLYAWHIDDLKIYDKPKELSEFESPKIDLSKEYGGSAVCHAYGRKKITRAPQSWCYIEELGAEE